MSFETKEKQAVLRRLQITREKAMMLETSLRFQRRSAEAEQVHERNDQLSDEIDRLLKELMSQWLGEAEAVEGQLREANTSLQTAIRNVDRSIAVAKNVTKALGLVDDVIDIARTLV
jgi:hypothetical protein